MTRRRTYGELDDAAGEDYDDVFLGVNAKLDPRKLPKGYVAYAENIRNNNGELETRGGHFPLPWKNTGDPYFFDKIFGFGVFSSPVTGQEYFVVATASNLWLLREGNVAIVLAIPAVLDAAVVMVQAFDKLLIFRGLTRSPWEWSGNVNEAVIVVDRDPEVSYLTQTPNADYAVVMNNRLVVPYNRDELAFSDLFDYTVHDPTLNSAKVNKGTADSVVNVLPTINKVLLVFKGNSIWRIANVVGDTFANLGDNLDLDMIDGTVGYGLAARDSVAAVNQGYVYLAKTGVYKLNQPRENLFQLVPVPISEPIEPWIERIDFLRREHVKSAFFNHRYYLHVPVDTDGYAVFVYNFKIEAWESWDTMADNFRIAGFATSASKNNKRLIAAFYDMSGNEAHFIGEYASAWNPRDNFVSKVSNERRAVTSVVHSRSYGGRAMGRKRTTRGHVGMRTWNPQYSIDVQSDGLNETRAVAANKTKDRTRFYTHTVPAGDPQNAPFREDYSVDFTDGFNFVNLGTTDFQRMQYSRENFRLRQRGEGFQVLVSNSKGRMNIVSMGTELKEGERRNGVLV